LASLPNGKYDTSDQQRASNDRGNARRFKDGKLTKLLRIKCSITRLKARDCTRIFGYHPA
jgi:hypothetical protein